MRRERQILRQLEEALYEARHAERELARVARQLQQQHNLIKALWRIVSEKLGIKPENLAAALAAVEKEESKKPKTAMPCPACGRPLQEHHAACIYCGATADKRLV